MLDEGNEGYTVLDTVIVTGNGGQREARRLALKGRPDMVERLEQGDEITLAAVPASSWKPTVAKVRRGESRLVV